MQSFRHFPIPRVTSLTALVFFLAAPLLRADIDLPVPPPPQPKSLTVQVYKGETVDIPLEGLSRSGFQLKFLVRKYPMKGFLSEPLQTSRTTATITYTHNAKTGLGVDRFRYAVQAANTGVSTPAEVVINIVERPPVFLAPVRLEFPPAPVGESSHQEFTIRNDGGGRVTGLITVPPPWSISGGSESYSLGPGESHDVFVTFAPAAQGNYSGALKFSHSDGVSVALEARAFEPISIVPSSVRLDSDGAGEVRTGAFLLRNNLTKDCDLTIEAPKGLVVEDEVHVPAGSEVQVAIHTRTGMLTALTGELKIKGENIVLDVPVEVAPAPPRLVAAPARIEFGDLGSGRTGRVSLTVRNTGGSQAEIRSVAPDGMQFRPEVNFSVLKPGESKEFEVSFSRLGIGKVEGVIPFEVGTSKLEIPYHANVIAKAMPGSPKGVDLPKIDFNDIPPVESIAVTRQTKTAVDLAWKKTAPTVARYEVFARRLGLNEKKQAVFRYQRLDRVKVRIVRDEARTTLEGLRPGEQVTIQIVAYDADEKPSRPSPPFTLASKPASSFRIPWTFLGIVLLVIAAIIIIFERRRRRNAPDLHTSDYF